MVNLLPAEYKVDGYKNTIREVAYYTLCGMLLISVIYSATFIFGYRTNDNKLKGLDELFNDESLVMLINNYEQLWDYEEQLKDYTQKLNYISSLDQISDEQLNFWKWAVLTEIEIRQATINVDGSISISGSYESYENLNNYLDYIERYMPTYNMKVQVDKDNFELQLIQSGGKANET